MYRFLLVFMATMYLAMLWPLIKSRIARRRWILLWGRWNFRQIPLALATLSCVMALGVALMQLHPAFSFSWISLVGGQGSLSTGGISSNAARADPSLFLASIFIFTSFLILIPQLAQIEERWFRRGSERRAVRKQVLVAVIFGLTHIIVGVPLAFGIGLTLLGLACTYRYLTAYAHRHSRHDAIAASTSFHLTYNSIIGFFVLVATVHDLSKPYLSAL